MDKIIISDEKRPGGLLGTEIWNVEDTQKRIWAVSINDILNLVDVDTTKELILPIATPINAEVAGAELTINSRPDDYVANVQSNITITVASQPNINIQSTGNITVSGTPLITKTYSSGTITITDTPSDGQLLTIGSDIYTFRTVANSPFEIEISADNTTQAENIVSTITADGVLLIASNLLGVVTVTTTVEGIAGDSVIFSSNGTGCALTGSGYLTGFAPETITVYDQVFNFVPLRTIAGEITISANNTTQATNIKNAINLDLTEVIATSLLGVVSLTAINEAPFVGTGGDVIILEEDATGIAVSGSGTLENGQNAGILTVLLDTYTFVDETAIPGVLEINLGADEEGTAANIASLVSHPSFTQEADSATVIFTASALTPGTNGDGLAIQSDLTGAITGSGVTSGGVDEVKSYLTINGIDYIFASSTGDMPIVDYPNCAPVTTANAASMTVIAAALVAKLKLDTVAFSTTSVSNTNEVITLNYKQAGIAGNDITYVNNLVVAGDITETGVSDGLLTGGINGTPGKKNQVVFEDGDLFICADTNLTVTNANWVSTTLTTF